MYVEVYCKDHIRKIQLNMETIWRALWLCPVKHLSLRLSYVHQTEHTFFAMHFIFSSCPFLILHINTGGTFGSTIAYQLVSGYLVAIQYAPFPTG